MRIQLKISPHIYVCRKYAADAWKGSQSKARWEWTPVCGVQKIFCTTKSTQKSCAEGPYWRTPLQMWPLLKGKGVFLDSKLIEEGESSHSANLAKECNTVISLEIEPRIFPLYVGKHMINCKQSNSTLLYMYFPWLYPGIPQQIRTEETCSVPHIIEQPTHTQVPNMWEKLRQWTITQETYSVGTWENC